MNEQIIKEAMTPAIAKTLFKFVTPVARKLGKTETGKYLVRARKTFQSEGARKALLELAETKDITRQLGKNMPKYFQTPETLTKGTRAGKFIRRRIGGAADMAATLSKGVAEAGWQAPIVVSKNLAKAMGKDIRSSRYKLVDAAPAGRFRKIDKSKLEVGDVYGKVFKKKVVGVKTGPKGQRELLVRKSVPGQALGIATSAPAFGAYTFAADKDKSMPTRIGSSVADAAMWTVAPTATFAGTLLTEQLKNKKKNKQKKFSGGNQ